MSHEDDRTIALMAATLAGAWVANQGWPGDNAVRLYVARDAVHLARALVAEVARTAEREKETDDHADLGRPHD